MRRGVSGFKAALSFSPAELMCRTSCRFCIMNGVQITKDRKGDNLGQGDIYEGRAGLCTVFFAQGRERLDQNEMAGGIP